jgi:hypothetical protein
MAALKALLDALLSLPNFYLFVGAVLLASTVASACTGKTIARYNGWVYRTKQPGTFWFCLAGYFLLGVYFIALFLSSRFHGHSN